MKSRKSPQPAEPFFLLFPWGKVAGMLFMLALVSMVVYRLSQTGGTQVQQACLPAMIVATVAGLAGIYTVSKTWGRDVYWVLVGVMIAAVIRLLISGGGVAIISFFTDIHRSWFVLFLGVYYLAFLTVDTWLALWILRNSEMKDREKPIHGNLWDMFG